MEAGKAQGLMACGLLFILIFFFCSVYICSQISLEAFHNTVNVIRKCLESEQVFITILLLLLLLGAPWCENFAGGFMKIVSLCYHT